MVLAIAGGSNCYPEPTLNQDYREIFERNRLLSGLEPEVLAVILSKLEVESFAPEEVILKENEPSDSIYLIGSGVVRIWKVGPDETQNTLSYLEEGDFFGDMGALEVAPRSASVSAATAVTLGRMRDEVVKEARPIILRNIVGGLMDRLRFANVHFVEELRRAEHLSLVGSMASGIVHDLRGIVGPADGYLQLLRDHATDDETLEWVDGIDRSLEQMLAMVQELLDFSRGKDVVPNLASVSVLEIVRDMEEQVLCNLPGRIQIELNVEYAGGMVVDRWRLLRALLNIVRNAVDAMPDGGRLGIRIASNGPNVTFSISDTGRGIPPDLIPKIFDPFFTHGKPTGTGLGMSVARKAIEAHGGRIGVSSTIGRGTTVEIILPVER